MRIAFAWLMIGILLTPAWAITVTSEESGELVFLEDVEVYTTAMCGAFGPNWEWNPQSNAYDLSDGVLSPDQRELTGTFDIPGTTANVSFAEALARQTDQVLDVQYDFTVNQTVQFNSLWVSFFLPCDRYGGSTITFRDGGGQVIETLDLPVSFGETHLASHSAVGTIEVAKGSTFGYDVLFPSGAAVHVQDNRAWSGRDFEVRIDLLGSYAGSPVPAGTEFSLPFSVSFPSAVDFQLDPYSSSSQTDTTGWIPYGLPWDASPLDVSWLNERPAGGHGFVTVEDGRLVFEDGTPARFWGVCASAAANFPTHADSEIIAERMAKFGINMVRTHHADAFWSDPNLFDESYGDTQHFDEDALDRFDYFIYCLKEQGIYTYLDQLVHRQFTTGDGVVNAGELPAAAKPYTIFDPTLIALQKQFSHDLWTHVNPYTGLAYKDDPAVALMDFTNENDIISHDVTVEPYATNLETMWATWAAAHAVDPNQPIRLVAERSSDVLRFIDEVQRDYYSDMQAYLRSIGVRVPITGNTWLVSGANLPSQATMDYMDAHSYWDHPTDNYTRFHNRAQVKANPANEGNNFACVAMSRVYGKPFVVSEWGHPWPNEWRVEGPLATAAVAAFQGWDGVLAYTYRHSTATPVDQITGPFDTFNDPAVFGMMPLGALVFRRPDVTTTGPPTAVVWQDSDIFGASQLGAWGGQPAYRSLVEETPLVTAFVTPTGSVSVAPTDYVPTAGLTWTEADTGELRRDWALGVGTIDTGRTQAAYGYLSDAGTVNLSDVSIEVTSPFAVVAVASMDEADISASTHLLVAAIGRAENTGMVYNVTRTQLRDAGAGPILVDPITGQVVIETSQQGWSVYALAPDGARTLLGQQSAAEGILTVDLGASAGTIYYELMSASRFADVPPDHWAFAEIEACAAAGIVAGYPDGFYRPTASVSRDQMAVFISRAMAGHPDGVLAGPEEATFGDVPTDHWAYDNVEYAVAQGVVEGYADGSYQPEWTVTRAQMAVFIARAIVSPTGEAGLAYYVPPESPSFTDVPTDYWSYKHIEYLAETGAVAGYPEGDYHPTWRVSRDQMAVYIARSFGLPV